MDINNLKKSENFLDVLVENLQTNIMIVNQDIKIELVNPFLKKMIHKDSQEIIGEKCGNALGCRHAVEEGKDCGETTACNSCSLRKTVISTLKNKSKHSENVLSREFYIGGEKVKKHFLYSCKSVNFNEKDMALLIMNDITELEERRILLEEMAITDFLTGLYNRRYIFDLLSNKEVQMKGFSIIMGDIDHFKKINDTSGHPIGDKVLKKVSKTIKEIVGKKGIVGRFGGEEFIVVLPHVASEEAYSYAEEIRKQIEALHISSYPSGVTISLGVTQYCQEQGVNKVIKTVDQLLYQAKKSGRNMTKV